MPWDIHAVPFPAEETKLPTGGIRHLDDQAAVGPQKFTRGFKIGDRLGKVLKNVEHRDGGTALPQERSLRQRGANHWNAIIAPGDSCRLKRDIQAGNTKTKLLEHSQKEAASAADVEHDALLPGIAEGAANK